MSIDAVRRRTDNTVIDEVHAVGFEHAKSMTLWEITEQLPVDETGWRGLHVQHYTSVIIIVILVLFGLYRRVRRTVGFQYLARGRITSRVVIFSILAVVILAAGAGHLLSYVSDALGLVVGGIIAYISARTTKFEMRNGRWGYLQHFWIGVGLVVIFVGRLAFRFIEISQDVGKIQSQASSPNQINAQNFSDPWTSGVFMLLVAYYIGYFVFLLRKAKALESEG